MKVAKHRSGIIPVPHGFFGREGGVSTGIYESLNCGTGSDDEPDHIAENRRRVAAVLGNEAGPVVTLYQTHSDICHEVAGSYETRPEGDALVTDVPGPVLAVTVADCGPVLFYGEKPDGGPVIGAAHAGWRGALGGILESAIEKMQDTGAVKETIRAACGPCLGPGSYEVGAEFREAFLEADDRNADFFRARERIEKYLFNLPAYILSRLESAGISHISTECCYDTYPAENGFFSYRRSVHRGEPDYGRQLAAITISKEDG